MAAKYKLSERSVNNLTGVDPELIVVAGLSLRISRLYFIVTEGLRTKKRQKRLYDAGASKTLNSFHLTGDAYDFAVIVDGKITWDVKYYREVSIAKKKAAKFLGIDIVWGGDFRNFFDGTHIQRRVRR